MGMTKAGFWNPTIKLTQADKDEVEALVDRTPRATAHGVLVAAYQLGIAAIRAEPTLLPPLLPRRRPGRPKSALRPPVDPLAEIESLSLDSDGPEAEPSPIGGPVDLTGLLEDALSGGGVE